MANSVDPDETAREPSHQDLHCLHRYLFWYAGLTGLTMVPCMQFVAEYIHAVYYTFVNGQKTENSFRRKFISSCNCFTLS